MFNICIINHTEKNFRNNDYKNIFSMLMYLCKIDISDVHIFVLSFI